MRFSDSFTDYELIDADNGERLERWGDILLIRPDPQIIWSGDRRDKRWNEANAIYHRSQNGGGYWEQLKSVPDVWSIHYKELTFRLKPMGFKHTGLFPEQAVNWEWMDQTIRAAKRPIRVLNLFAYTGGATLACAAAGASVVHLDAAKGMVQWAKENAALSGLADRPIRWIVDDCQKFIQREKRRQNSYEAIIMDPPSYGRGPTGEVWKLEENIFELLLSAVELLSDKPLFFLLNSYTTGLSAAVMQYMLATATKSFGGVTGAYEIGLPVTKSGLILPQGSTAVWTGSTNQ